MNDSPLNFLILACVAALGCKSAPQATPPEEDPTAILDAPIPQSQRPVLTGSSSEPMMVLPETPQNPSFDIDAKDSDWKGKKFRQFNTKSSIQEGAQSWSGKKDAAMRVGIEADEGFVYVFVEVTDDTVITAREGDDPSDGVVLWLRDPGLDLLGKSLPANVGLHEYVDAETAILFHPDGRVEAYGGRDAIKVSDVVIHKTVKSKTGYTVEAAIKLEAFEEISSLPLSEIAFRVELLDGDDPARPGYQTILSTTPDRGADAPRMAIFAAGGVLPHAQVGTPPPRLNAMGRWKVENGTWNFVSFEVLPKIWATFEDPDAILATLRGADELKDICAPARKDVHLVEAYETRGGKFRTALVLCGQRAEKGKCPGNAQSNLLVVSMAYEADEWRVSRVINVLDKPSDQCTYDAVKGEPFYAHLSFYPLDILSANVWVVGWTRTTATSDEVEEAYGITFLNAEYEVPHLGTTLTRSTKVNAEERTISNSSVYLTYVDDDDNVDICQIEDYIEQACEGFDRGCVTYEHGRTVLTHIQMWSAKKRKFERYELSKHPGCSSAFDFSDARGYLFLQLKDRIGLLPSPRTNDDSETDKLDLF